MAKSLALLLPFLLILLFSIVNLGIAGERDPRGKQDPQRRLEQCKQQCQEQERGQQQQQYCERRCQKEYGEEERGEHRGEGDVLNSRRDPEERLERCKKECQHQAQDQRRCERRCEEDYRQQKQEERERGHEGNPGSEGVGRREREESTEHPYHFDRQRFTERLRTQEGYERVLERFTERSELLRGLENYRVAYCEANPHSFVIPHHKDAEGIFYVVKGRGTIVLLRQDNKESYNLEQGDVIRVPSGTTIYLVNRDNNEKLQIAKLLQPVANPGHYEAFYGAGGEDPQSFYRIFSDDILEAAFNTPQDKLQRLFGQQKKGAIIRASEEQVRAISRQASSKGLWPIKVETGGPFNLLKKSPSYQNRYGQLYEMDHNDYHPLRDVDVAVSLDNITGGAMTAMRYNSHATIVSVVLDGSGYFEMACPHLTSSGRREKGQRTAEQYQKVTARLSPGDVIVVPAGHPFVTVASPDQNLQLLRFVINSKNNHKYFLAGKNNILKQMDKEETELSFDVPARQVDEVFDAQKEAVFLAGPEQRKQHRGWAYE